MHSHGALKRAFPAASACSYLVLYLRGGRLCCLQSLYQFGVIQKAPLCGREAQKEVFLQVLQLYLKVILVLCQNQLTQTKKSLKNGG